MPPEMLLYPPIATQSTVEHDTEFREASGGPPTRADVQLVPDWSRTATPGSLDGVSRATHDPTAAQVPAIEDPLMRVEVGVVVQVPEPMVSMKGPTPQAVQARGAVGAHQTEAREAVADELLDVQVPDVRTSSSPEMPRMPTATQPPDALQDTDVSELGDADTVGDQVVPTSDSISAPVPDDPVAVPTATHPVAVGHETPKSAMAVWPAGRASRVGLQVEPLSCSTKLLDDDVPTAVHAVLTQETPVSVANVAPAGSIPVTAVHFLPLRDSTRA
jgi:hypothetical protein